MPNRRKHESPVSFVCECAPTAKQVFLVGGFNDWNPTDTRMVKRNGAFRRKVDLPPGEHQYKFVVDGRWQTDSAAILQVHNGLGTMNSVLHV